MLRCESVSKSYTMKGREFKALDGVTLDVERGDFVSIVGRSGSGKSTLLLMLGGMLSPSAGKVFADGDSVYDLPVDARATWRRGCVGFVFQTFNLIPYLTAVENVQVPLLLAGASDERQRSRAAELLDRMGLSDRLDHKPRELSIGQQQRVALARVMANDPAVILADEPTGNLDPETGQQVLAFLEEMNREGRTVVMVTHDPRAAERAGRTLRLVDGRLTTERPAQAHCKE